MRKRGLPIIAGAAGGILGAAIADHLKKKKVNAIEETSEKRREFYHVLVQWLALKADLWQNILKKIITKRLLFTE